jgi:hypothetical protein
MPATINTGNSSHGASGRRRRAIARRHDHQRVDHHQKPARCQRLRPKVRRKHVGGGDAQLLRGAHSHAEDQHAAGENGKTVHAHRQPDQDRAGERQHEAEQNAGLAAVAIGDLADRVGNQKPAQSEQADRQSRQRRGSSQGDHHQRPEAVRELHARASERLGKRKQRGIALDQRWNAGRSVD